MKSSDKTVRPKSPHLFYLKNIKVYNKIVKFFKISLKVFGTN